jgi:hypothetical protein
VVELDSAAQLLEIEGIKQLKARYFRLLDTKQWSDLRLQFCDDCVYDGTSAPYPDADAFVDGLSRSHAATRTVHHGHMPEIVLNGRASARAIWSMVDYVTWSGDSGPKRSTVSADMSGWIGYGYYQEEYRKEDGIWKISRLRLTRLRVDPIIGRPAEPLPGMLAPALDWLPSR